MRIINHLETFLVVALLSLFSCSKTPSAFNEKSTPHHFAELRQANDLMNTNLRQARTFLDSLQQTETVNNWSKLEQQEFIVMRTEADFKNGAINDHSLDLYPTVSFFDSLSLTFPNDKELRLVQAKARYYQGTESRYSQHDVPAVTEFVKAIEVTREAFPDSNDPQIVRFRGLSYFRIGEILISYNIQSGAIDAFETAKSCFEQVNDTLGIAASIRNIGEVFQSNKDYEKALERFHEANRLWDFGNSLYDHALGGIFFNHQQLDSACNYLERSFMNSSPYAQIDASAKLAEIYKEKGVKEKEDYYTMFYVQNSIRETNRSSDKMEIEFIIGALNDNPTPQKDDKLNVGLIAIIASVILIIIILTSIIAHNRKRISHIEKHISTIEQIHREETEGKDDQIKAISKQLDDTKQRLERQNKPMIDFDQALESFLQSPITKKVHRSVDGKDIMTKSVSLYPQLKLSEVDFIEVVRTANKYFPGFSSQLLHDYNNLSTADVRHCCLAIMGLNDAEIAVLEGITYSGANRRTNRILSIMGENVGLAECVLVYLRSLYN